METYFFIFITGIGVSFISTLFGLGGGIIMVPILSLILPYSHLEAVATSLATIVMVTSFNTYNFNKKDVIVWRIVPWIALTSSIFSFTSVKIAVHLPQTILILIFLLFLLWVALRTFLIKNDIKSSKSNNVSIPLGIGSLSGAISGFTGIGGGGITTPLMLISGITKNIQAAPTSNAIMIFTALFASLSYALMDDVSAGKMIFGYIHLDTSIILFLGSALFSRIGVKLNNLFPLFWRKTILGIILLLVSVRLFLMII
ncbi:MAG: sulfite exporter TauE/SafE family protein [Calditrichia bacterium]|nr:sulfite exporter TauE/SafE family protein [Calditrichia bacterium]